MRRIWLKNIGSGHGVTALTTFTIAFTAVATIAVTAAAFALWTLLTVLRFGLALWTLTSVVPLLPLAHLLCFLRCFRRFTSWLNVGGGRG